MGLDMYLSKRVYVGANYEHNNVQGEINLTSGKENKPIAVNLKRVSAIIEIVAYWRKDNHIHRWFVENVQDGEDDCKEYYVEQELLGDLVSLCEKVLSNKEQASELLPTSEGFFFGNTQYNEYYFESLQYTIDMLKPLLKEEGDFYYDSSW